MSEQVRVRAAFKDLRGLKQALEELRSRGLREVRVFSPVGLPGVEALLPRRRSPVRFSVLAAGLLGASVGFFMSIGSTAPYRLILGGKHPSTIPPYCIPGFEFTILFGGVTAFFTWAFLAALSPRHRPADYDPRFNEDQYGVVVECSRARGPEALALLRAAGGEEAHEQPISNP